MKKLIVGIIFYITTMTAYAQESHEIKTFSENNIHVALGFIPQGVESHYGIDSRKDFEACVVGNPIRMSTINEHGNIELQNYWRVPIILHEKYTSFMTVILNDSEKLEVVGIGGHALAQEIQTHINSGHTINLLLRIYSHKIDFVSDVENMHDLDVKQFIPLQSAHIYIQNNNKSMINKYNFSELLDILSH